MDFYEILGITEDASQEDVKKAYQQLVLIHHPDKNSKEGNLETFLRIEKAYKTLKEPSSRKEYNSRRFQQAARTQLIIHDTVQSSEFLYDESNEVHYYVCKCGGWYILDEEDTEDEYIICCDECSLVIKVLNKTNTES